MNKSYRKIVLITSSVVVIGVIIYYFLVGQLDNRVLNESHDVITIEKDDLIPEDGERLDVAREAALQANQKIEFFGKCVDQHGQPVAGALVSATVTKMRTSKADVLTHSSFKQHISLTVTSDAAGLFSITDNGSFLNIDDVTKPGYYGGRNKGPSGFAFGQLLYGDQLAGMHVPDPNDPIVYVLWKKSEFSRAIRTKSRDRLDTAVRFGSEGQNLSHWFDLRTGRPSDGMSQCGIRITGSSDGSTRWDQENMRWIQGERNYRWSFQLSIPGGGLQQTDDIFQFMAPSDNYHETFEFEMNPNLPNWETDLKNRGFYFRTADGIYGSFRLHASAGPTGGMTFRFLEVVLNPTGERVLEIM